MSDRWADVRKLFVFKAPLDSDDDEQKLFRDLLTDADALLAVVPFVQHRETCPLALVDPDELEWDECICGLSDALAALPERLR